MIVLQLLENGVEKALCNHYVTSAVFLLRAPMADERIQNRAGFHFLIKSLKPASIISFPIFSYTTSSILNKPLPLHLILMHYLISGAGIAGPTFAWWASKTGSKVTIVEKASSLLSIGQNIDVHGSALKVIRKMDLIDALKKLNTTVSGLRASASNGRDLLSPPFLFSLTHSIPSSEIFHLSGERYSAGQCKRRCSRFFPRWRSRRWSTNLCNF